MRNIAAFAGAVVLGGRAPRSTTITHVLEEVSVCLGARRIVLAVVALSKPFRDRYLQTPKQRSGLRFLNGMGGVVATG